MAGTGIKINVTVNIPEDGIGIVNFDAKDSSANVFNQQTMRQLSQCIEELEAHAALKGVIFTSSKPSIFIAGADIREILKPDLTPDELREMIRFGQNVFQRIARLKAVTVAAIHGACLGGGFELCLACDYRLATPDKSTKVGLPETSLGILPAWGGTTRLPRLIGLPTALDLVLGGKRLNARKAKKIGLIDQIVHREHLDRFSRSMIKKGKPQPRNRFLTNNSLSSKIISAVVKKKLLEKTQGNYPAQPRALDVMVTALNQPVETGLALECEAMLELGQTSVCRNLVRIFFLQERAKKLTLHDLKTKPIQQIEVIGAGIMGSGIAQWVSSRGIKVLLKDIAPEALNKGMQAIGKLYYGAVKRGLFDKAQAQRGQDLVTPVSDDVNLKQVDMVIEAAVENMDIKRSIFTDLARKTKKSAILATNTSALSVSELAESVPQPERVIGVHFFNPVSRMQLVEVVVGEQTSDKTVQQCVRFIQQIGKLPVVVKDRPGFLVNRILIPYMIEAGYLFNHGASMWAIDKCMLKFGMPMGPLRLIDEVGVDVASHVSNFFQECFGDRMPVPSLLGKMIDAKFLGRKSGKGFFVYGGKGTPGTNAALLEKIESRKYADLAEEELQKRMVLLMINEAARCIEEGVVTDPRDVDFGMIMGTGFAPFRGGPLRYADTVGINEIVVQMTRLSTAHPRFEPCKLLTSMAKDNVQFYYD